jgi:hypothetical protein
LRGAAVSELAQEDPQRGRGVDRAEYLLHPTRPHDIQMVDAVRSAAIPAMIGVSFRVELAAPDLTRSQATGGAHPATGDTGSFQSAGHSRHISTPLLVTASRSGPPIEA